MEMPTHVILHEKKSLLYFRLPLWFYRIFYYEYWPFQLLFFPTLFYWFYLSLKARSLVYFTATNPAIDLGGFFGESKIDILNKVQEQYKPKTVCVHQHSTMEEIRNVLHAKDISYPVICKPDKGEMGFLVRKISNEQELSAYFKEGPEEIIVQEFVDFSVELGVLYYKFPDGRSGISSVVEKEFLTVRGDGRSTVELLMNQHTRARFQLQRFKKEKPEVLNSVPLNGQTVLLEPVGNHCKGTRFMNGERLINQALVHVFDDITSTMNGFYFGRFDLKVKSMDDLYTGENIRILEVNGTTSEPAHIYGAGMNLYRAYQAIFYNMRLVNDIAIANHKNGIPFMSVKEVWSAASKHFKMKREHGN